MNFNPKFRVSSFAWHNLKNVQGLRVSFILLGLALFWLLPVLSQEGERAEPAAEQFFSGIVTDNAPDSLTVTRSVLGKSPVTRTFQITPETKIEGRLRVKARVTVQYAPGDDGDRAVHIIVRSTQPKKEKGTS